MKELLIAKIERNPERIETWKFCKEMATSNPNEFRIRYDEMNFYLEKFCRVIGGKAWVRTVVSEPER